jgi:hypothetical protein
MKKLLIIPALILIANLSVAQFLKFGVKGGANLVKLSGISFEEGYDLGYYAGAFAEVKLNEKWFIQPEIQFGETDLSYSNEFKDIYEDLLNINNLSSMKLQRLSIPITLNYKIANVLSLSAGTQFSIITEKGQTLLQNAGNAFSDGDLGILAGANIHLSKFRVHARYVWGLNDMNNIDGQDEWKAQTAQIGVGFVF